jgi:hypothetical protein
MERGAVVGPFEGELHEVSDVIRGLLGEEIDHHLTDGGLDHRLLVPHLLESEGSGEELLECYERSQCEAHEVII